MEVYNCGGRGSHYRKFFWFNPKHTSLQLGLLYVCFEILKFTDKYLSFIALYYLYILFVKIVVKIKNALWDIFPILTTPPQI